MRWLFLLALLGTSFAQAEEVPMLRIALTRDAGAAPLLIAADRHDFEAEGIRPQLILLDSDAAVTAAIAAGRADIGLATTSAPLFAAAAGHKLKIIAARDSDQTGFPIAVLLIGAKAPGTGLKLLSSGRIGIPASDSADAYGLFEVARRFSIASVRTVPLSDEAQALATLRRGAVDAVLLPYAQAVRAAGKGETILRLSDYAQGQHGVVFAAAGTIAGRREVVQRFLRGYQRGTAEYQINFLHYDDGGDFIQGPHYREELAALSRRLGLAPALLATTKRYCDRRGNPDAEDLGRQVRFWQDRRKLDKAIAPADLLDLSFIGEEMTVDKG